MNTNDTSLKNVFQPNTTPYIDTDRGDGTGERIVDWQALYQREHAEGQALLGLLAEARKEAETLRGALQGTRCKANVMQFLWQAAEEEMRSDDPVEVRLRKDLEDADASHQELCKVNASLKLQLSRIREWVQEQDDQHAEYELADPELETEWAPVIGACAELRELIAEASL